MPEDSSAPWSVRDRWKLRMQLLALESQLTAAIRNEDAALADLSPEDARARLETYRERWEALEAMRTSLSAQRPFRDGDASCLVHDEPVFGDHNPPEPDRYLYHYTRAWTLPKIKKTRSLRFGPLSAMNDPHEAVDSHALMAGLAGQPGEPLQLTAQQSERFQGTNWLGEINAARRCVKVGSFSMDAVPDLQDVDPQTVEFTVPRRLLARRGFAHPRMWAQYADDSRGVCLILRYAEFEAAVADSVGGRFPWRLGAVTYDAAEQDLSLGFFDARQLVGDGAQAALLSNFKQSLLTKHADWAHEAEFRFFVMDGTPEPWFVPITSEVVAGLILGPKFDGQRHLRNVRAFAGAFGIAGRVRHLDSSHGRPTLRRVLLQPPRPFAADGLGRQEGSAPDGRPLLLQDAKASAS